MPWEGNYPSAGGMALDPVAVTQARGWGWFRWRPGGDAHPMTDPSTHKPVVVWVVYDRPAWRVQGTGKTLQAALRHAVDPAIAPTRMRREQVKQLWATGARPTHPTFQAQWAARSADPFAA